MMAENFKPIITGFLGKGNSIIEINGLYLLIKVNLLRHYFCYENIHKREKIAMLFVVF